MPESFFANCVITALSRPGVNVRFLRSSKTLSMDVPAVSGAFSGRMGNFNS
jgi:hypothetical protein